MSLDRHMNEGRKEHSVWNTEIHNISVATLTSVNDVRSRAFGDNLQTPPKFLAKSMPSPASVYTCNVMEARGADTNETRMALPAIVNSSSHLVSRTAFDTAAREATALGPVLDAFALTLSKEASEANEMGEVVSRHEVAHATSRSKSPDIQEDKYPILQTTPVGWRETRSMKPQIGDRSRFRPWGYI